VKVTNVAVSLFFYILLLSLSACSTVDAYLPRSTVPTYDLPVIPEIKPQVVQPRVIQQPKRVIRSSTVQVPTVKPYTNKSTQPVKKVTVQDRQKQLEEQRLLEEEARQKAISNSVVDIDPYATIPETSVTVVSKKAPSSAAVRTLMVSARADIALGRSRSAVTKLERGLRIEPQNADLWHMLAKAHFSNSAYLHAISMAKKSNANTQDRHLINQNWKLIKEAGIKSDNASAIKEALDYMKLNP